MLECAGLAPKSAITTCGARVVPGRRARLIGLKLDRDLALAAAVRRVKGGLVKFRRLRRLMAKDDKDGYAISMFLELDPVAGRESAQIPLLRLYRLSVLAHSYDDLMVERLT